MSQLYTLCNSRRSGNLAASLLLGAILFVSGLAHAAPATAPLSAKERALLQNHREVARRLELLHKGRRYVAALSYGVVRRSCDRVFGLLSDPASHYAKALPATSEVRFEEAGGRSKIWMKHGNMFINGSYTAHFRPSPDQGFVRFWLDHEQERDVEDLFGYFRVSPWGDHECLVTAAVAVDPGEGMVASMFRGMIGDYVAKSAGRIQRYARRTLPVTTGSTSTGLVTAAATQ